jgi:hypothetical protein
VRAAPTEDLRAELNRRRAAEDAPVSRERSNDLRVELNRRRAGDDARVSLERARERRQNIEGHNLDQDFAAVTPQTSVGAQIVTPRILQLNFFFSLLAKIRALPFPFLFPSLNLDLFQSLAGFGLEFPYV